MSLPAPTPEWLSALSAIAGAAGREVLDVYGGAFTSRTKEDGSPVTEADLRADAAIRRGLAAAFPGVFVLSEESVSAPAGPAPRFFLVDPLDGTKEFLQRNGEFTVNIALVEGGEPVAGVVLAPALGLLWGAARGHGAARGLRGRRRAAPAPRRCAWRRRPRDRCACSSAAPTATRASTAG